MFTSNPFNNPSLNLSKHPEGSFASSPKGVFFMQTWQKRMQTWYVCTKSAYACQSRLYVVKTEGRRFTSLSYRHRQQTDSFAVLLFSYTTTYSRPCYACTLRFSFHRQYSYTTTYSTGVLRIAFSLGSVARSSQLESLQCIWEKVK